MLFQLKISEEVEVVQAPNHVRAAKQCVLCGKTTSEGCGSKRKCKAPCPVDNCELLLSFKCLNCKFAYCEEHFVIGSHGNCEKPDRKGRSCTFCHSNDCNAKTTGYHTCPDNPKCNVKACTNKHENAGVCRSYCGLNFCESCFAGHKCRKR